MPPLTLSGGFLFYGPSVIEEIDVNLFRRLLTTEDNFIERKSSFDKNELREAAVAFANTLPEGQTGVIFYGVLPDGALKGMNGQNLDSLQKTIADYLSKDCIPPIEFQTKVLLKDEKEILSVVIYSSKRKPHFPCKSWVRIGSETKQMSEAKFEELIAARNGKTEKVLSWKNQTVTVKYLEFRAQMGGRSFPFDSGWKECNVVDCDAHFITLKKLSSATIFSEPLELVTFSYDHEHKRLLIHINRKSWIEQ
jgi:hypothetical protein